LFPEAESVKKNPKKKITKNRGKESARLKKTKLKRRFDAKKPPQGSSSKKRKDKNSPGPAKKDEEGEIFE